MLYEVITELYQGMPEIKTDRKPGKSCREKIQQKRQEKECGRKNRRDNSEKVENRQEAENTKYRLRNNFV